MISSENELAELLEARKTTRFAKIIQQETDLQMTLILFGAALITLVLHFYLAADFYGVKLAQWSGNMVETTSSWLNGPAIWWRQQLKSPVLRNMNVGE